MRGKIQRRIDFRVYDGFNLGSFFLEAFGFSPTIRYLKVRSTIDTLGREGGCIRSSWRMHRGEQPFTVGKMGS